MLAATLIAYLGLLVALPSRPSPWLVVAAGLPVLAATAWWIARRRGTEPVALLRAYPDVAALALVVLHALGVQLADTHGITTDGVTYFTQLRSLVFDGPLVPKLLPMTGVAFVLFTFYMVTDPATTPVRPRNQVLFGAAVAVAYGALVTAHVVFGLFFALSIVCAGRGVGLLLLDTAAQRAPAKAPRPAPAPAAVEGSGA